MNNSYNSASAPSVKTGERLVFGGPITGIDAVVATGVYEAAIEWIYEHGIPASHSTTSNNFLMLAERAFWEACDDLQSIVAVDDIDEDRDISTKRRGFSQSQRRHLLALLINRDGTSCTYCTIDLTDKTATIDHIFPVVRGGSDDLSNLTLACKPCNSRKGAKILEGVE